MATMGKQKLFTDLIPLFQYLMRRGWDGGANGKLHRKDVISIDACFYAQSKHMHISLCSLGGLSFAVVGNTIHSRIQHGQLP